MKEEEVIRKEVEERHKLKRIMEALNSSVTTMREEFPDKITWGEAGNRKEFKFNSSDLDEANIRLDNFQKIIKRILEAQEAEKVKTI